MGFWEKLPIGGVGIAEMGSYGPADKHIQTQKLKLVSSEIFNMALISSMVEKKIGLSHVVIVGFDQICQKELTSDKLRYC